MHGSVVGGDATWGAQRTLAERFELVVPDRRGFSPNPPVERVDFEDEAEWLESWLEPGTHLGFTEILKAADDTGILVALSQPHFGQYQWQAPDANEKNGYARDAAFYVRVAQNHPSVVFYSTSHNGAGYSEDMNPDLLDGVHEPRDQWSARGAQRARRAERLVASAVVPQARIPWEPSCTWRATRRARAS